MRLATNTPPPQKIDTTNEPPTTHIEELFRQLQANTAGTRPSNPAATRILANIRHRLDAATRLINNGQQPALEDRTSETYARWLKDRIPTLRLHPEAGHVLTDLQRLHNQALRLIDNHPDRYMFGYCVGEVPDEQGNPQQCGTAVIASLEEGVWQCPNCAERYHPHELYELRIQRARSLMLTLDELALLTGKKPDTVRKQLERRGITPLGSYYRAADYLDSFTQPRS